MIEHLIPEWRKQHKIAAWAPVGSRVTCDPAPGNTDADFLILLDNPTKSNDVSDRFSGELRQWHWVIGGSKPVMVDDYEFPADEAFTSFTRGEINLIVTESPVFFKRFMAATAMAKRYNLLEKADRIALFQAVMYGSVKETPSELNVRYPDVEEFGESMNEQLNIDDLI